MTISDNDPFNLGTNSLDIDVTSETSGSDDSNQLLYFCALTVLGLVVVTVVEKAYQCRKEIRENWKWSRQQSPKLKDSIVLMMKSAVLAGCIRSEIEQWEDSLRTYEHMRSEMPKDSSSVSYKKMRAATTDHVVKAARKVVGAIFTNYIQEGKILEIGANELVYPDKSYLCQLAPDSMQKEFVFSDRFIPESLSEDQRRNYRQIDITNISDSLDEPLSNIVALSVIDTISRKKLPRIAEELSSVLKPGGRVIVLSDLLFDQGPFAERHSENDKLVIPTASTDFLGGKVISIEKLKERASIFGSRFAKFIDSLLMLSPKDRFNYLMATQKQLSLNLVSILKEICAPNDYEMVDHRTSYIEDLRSAFTSTGEYTIVEDGYCSATVEEDGVILKPSRYGRRNIILNKVAIDANSSDFCSFSLDPAVTLGRRELTSTIYAMVLEKSILK